MTGAEKSPRLAILNLVGLCNRILGPNTPNLQKFIDQNGGKAQLIDPVCPAVTCSAQATYLTGKTPSEHGIVGNGWYDRALHEHHFWKQSNRLVEGKKYGKPYRKTGQIFVLPICSGGLICTAAWIPRSLPALSIDRMD